MSVSATAQLGIVETKLLSREPGTLFSILIPLFILIVFGASTRSGDAQLAATVLTVSVGLIALYLMPTTLASYREKGILRRLSTTPVQPSSILVVQLLLQFTLTLVSCAATILVATLALGAAAPSSPLALAAVYALGTLSMFGVGLVIAALAPSGRAANGIGVLLYFPLAYLAGLLQPVSMMPTTMVRIGEFTPLGALRQSLQHAWTGAPLDVASLSVMAAYAVVLTLIAARLFRWE